MKIRSRLLWLVFVAWLPAALAIGIVARSTYIEQKNAALDDVRQIADGLGTIVERELDKRVVMARTLSASSALQAGDLAHFHAEALRATQGTDSWAVLLTPKHQVVNTARPFDPDFRLPRVPDAVWLQHGERAFFTMQGPLLRKPVVGVLAAQVAPPSAYNIAIAFAPDVLQNIVARQSPPHNAVVTVMDENLQVVARSRDPAKWLGSHATGPLKERARAGKAGFEPSVTLDKVPSLTYLSRPNRHGWYAVAAVPTLALDQQARKAAADAVSLAAVLLGLSLLFALHVARSISKPILELKDAADELGQERVPALSSTGLFETDEVAKALHHAALRARESADILEAKVSEAVAKAAQVQAKLAESQKREAVGRLAGGIAHDFNNLLQTISAAHHLLIPTTPDGPPKRMLEAASRATGKATGLVKQMLSFGRAQPLEPKPIDLADFLLQTSELAGKAAGASVALSASIQPGLPAVLADPTQFELALINLIFNARDAMQGHGRIDMRAALVTAADAGLTEGASRPYVRIDVQDDGPGMDATTQQKAFEPYFTTKPVGAGSGLGLAQVLAFARQSGGDARLLSTVGTGTTVQLFLPTTGERSTAQHERGAIAPPAARALRVLMVEDDPLVASVVVPAIRSAGHEVIHCLNADDARETLLRGEQDVDVVFSDIVMPGTMTGHDLARWCRDTRRMPVVLATGYSAQAPQADVTILRKPYHLGELLQALQAAADTPQARPQSPG